MTKEKLLADQTIQTPEDKMERMMTLIVQLSDKMTVLERESSERQALQIENPAPGPAVAAGKVKTKEEDEEEKVMVDEEAMELMEKMYMNDMEMPVDDLTGTPARVFVEDHVDFETHSFPMLIKRDMMNKRNPDNTSHNPKVDKCKTFIKKTDGSEKYMGIGRSKSKRVGI